MDPGPDNYRSDTLHTCAPVWNPVELQSCLALTLFICSQLLWVRAWARVCEPVFMCCFSLSLNRFRMKWMGPGQGLSSQAGLWLPGYSSWAQLPFICTPNRKDICRCAPPIDCFSVWHVNRLLQTLRATHRQTHKWAAHNNHLKV